MTVPPAPLSRLVGQYGDHIPEGGLVDAQTLAHVLRFKDPFGGVLSLGPCGEVAQVFLVVPSEQVTVHMEPAAKGTGGDGRVIQLPLKKIRALGYAALLAKNS